MAMSTAMCRVKKNGTATKNQRKDKNKSKSSKARDISRLERDYCCVTTDEYTTDSIKITPLESDVCDIGSYEFITVFLVCDCEIHS